MMIFWSHCGYLREGDHYYITLLHTGNISPPPSDPAPPLTSLMMYETHFLRPSYHTRQTQGFEFIRVHHLCQVNNG